MIDRLKLRNNLINTNHHVILEEIDNVKFLVEISLLGYYNKYIIIKDEIPNEFDNFSSAFDYFCKLTNIGDN